MQGRVQERGSQGRLQGRDAPLRVGFLSADFRLHASPPSHSQLRSAASPPSHSQLRVGFLSADFRLHASPPSHSQLRSAASPPSHSQLRVGFLSADFRLHVMAFLTLGMLELLSSHANGRAVSSAEAGMHAEGPSAAIRRQSGGNQGAIKAGMHAEGPSAADMHARGSQPSASARLHSARSPSKHAPSNLEVFALSLTPIASDCF